MFALSEFAVAWVVALVYARKASQDFDQMAAAISGEFAIPIVVGTPAGVMP